MGYWFEKGESRRFPRISMPIQVHITPITPIRSLDIYALGINYFPPSVEKKIQQTKLDVWHWVKRIQEQKDILDPVFIEAVDLIDNFGEVIKAAQQGRNPELSDPKDPVILQKLFTGFQKIFALQEPAPKTFYYFDQMNQKFLVYAQNLVFSLKKSSPGKFVSTMDFQTDFELDNTIANFSKPKFKQVPLAQALFYLARYLDLHINAYVEYLNDLQPLKTARKAPTKNVDISACGLAVKSNKRFPLGCKVNVLLYFADTNEALKLSSTIVRSATVHGEETECNAVDYYFPNGKDQNIIQRQIELQQLYRCPDVTL